MYPEDRVLIGVINSKRDLQLAQEEHWYRIPQEQMPKGVDTEYLGFFLSGAVFKQQNHGVFYYGRCTGGVELAHRRDLIPHEADHARAEQVYYKVMVQPLKEKLPPILNPTRRKFSFIKTTWDRFVRAEVLKDLYSDDDQLVDRIFHVLRQRGYALERTWEADRRYVGYSPQLRVLCQRGEVVVSTQPNGGNVYLHSTSEQDATLAQIQAAIQANDGPVMLGLPYRRG
jgi:hypothetical protein